MTAVYRITHDHWTPDRAFAEMVQYQFKKGFVSHDALKNFVYNFTAKAGGHRRDVAGQREIARLARDYSIR